jgi:hypothetical protein
MQAIDALLLRCFYAITRRFLNRVRMFDSCRGHDGDARDTALGSPLQAPPREARLRPAQGIGDPARGRPLDKNKDGIYNDAPAAVPDANRDGRINAVDLKAYGVASNIVAVPFQISD